MSIDPTNLPASSVKRLANATDRDCPLKHTRQRSNRNILGSTKGQVLINFVVNYGHIMLDTEPCDQFKLGASEDSSGWIMWRVEYEGTRLFGKRSREFVGIKCPGGR